MATRKPKQPFGPADRVRFLEEIRQGNTRTVALETLGIQTRHLDRALRTEIGFRRALRDAEMEAVRQALQEAALSGNIPAIEMVLDRSTVPDGPQLSGIDAETRRIALSLA